MGRERRHEFTIESRLRNFEQCRIWRADTERLDAFEDCENDVDGFKASVVPMERSEIRDTNTEHAGRSESVILRFSPGSVGRDWYSAPSARCGGLRSADPPYPLALRGYVRKLHGCHSECDTLLRIRCRNRKVAAEERS